MLGKRENLSFCTYKELLQKTIGAAYKPAPANENGNINCFDLVRDGRPEKFDSIIVDEGQDFDDDMGLTVRLFLKSNTASSLYIFYDVKF